MEPDILWQHLMDSPLAFPANTASFRPKFPPFDLSKAPLSYSEALARPDASVWQAAMDREKNSL